MLETTLGYPLRSNFKSWLWGDCKSFRSFYVQPFVATTIRSEQKILDITAEGWSIVLP